MNFDKPYSVPAYRPTFQPRPGAAVDQKALEKFLADGGAIRECPPQPNPARITAGGNVVGSAFVRIVMEGGKC